jgi:hypothetical protein
MSTIILFRLTLRSVLQDVPHDLAAFVTYALLLAFVGFIYLGSRKPGGGGGPAEPGERS